MVGRKGHTKDMTDDTNPKDLVGAKKVRLSYVPPSSIIYQALAMEDGAEKYGPYNWREKKVQAMIYLDAAMRHLAAWQDGEENAADSGKPHLAHALGCIGILVDALETGNLIDNRPPVGAASSLIEKFKKKSTIEVAKTTQEPAARTPWDENDRIKYDSDKHKE